jgi:predicted alpha/beta hydrolase family esterase
VRLPFPALLVGSTNDPYCSVARAQQFGRDWGTRCVSLGARGHVNADDQLPWFEVLDALPRCAGVGGESPLLRRGPRTTPD